jgi:hypothetical protein
MSKKKKEKKAEEKLAMILLACMYVPVVVIGLAAKVMADGKFSRK